MGYVGRGLNTGQYSKLDSIAGSFDGSVTTFSLEQNGTAVTPSAQNCLISLGGVIQEPFVAFSVTGSILNFTEAPATDDTFFGIVMGEAAFIAGNTVGQNELQAPSSIASYIGNEISGSIVGGVSGSAISTGSFGSAHIMGNVNIGITVANPSASAVLGSSDTSFTISGSIFPEGDAKHDLGSANYQWKNIYTSDFHLNNTSKTEGNSVDGTKGSWTIQEGREDLYLLNNETGKKFKFKLEEVK